MSPSLHIANPRAELIRPVRRKKQAMAELPSQRLGVLRTYSTCAGWCLHDADLRARHNFTDYPLECWAHAAVREWQHGAMKTPCYFSSTH